MSSVFDRESERLATVVRLASSSSEAREKLIEEYQRLSEAAFAPETLRNYQQIKGNFERWCHENGHSAVPPVEPTVVAEYIESLGGKLKSTTIQTRLWAIWGLLRLSAGSYVSGGSLHASSPVCAILNKKQVKAHVLSAQGHL